MVAPSSMRAAAVLETLIIARNTGLRRIGDSSSGIDYDQDLEGFCPCSQDSRQDVEFYDAACTEFSRSLVTVAEAT